MITDISRYKKIKGLTGLIGAILVLMILTIMIYTMIINNWKDTQLSIINKVKEDKFEQIFIYYTELDKQAETLSKEIANSIQESIKTSIDMNELKDDFDNETDSYNDKLNKIYDANVDNVHFNNVNNRRNGVLVLTSNSDDISIVKDFNYRRASDNTEYSEPRNYTNNYNKELFDESLNRIKDRYDGIIGIEYDYPENKNHIKITSMNKTNLLKVYKEEGIEGLKNYQFEVPSYITDTGDIFGQKDIINGKLQDTHKIIVVVEFNLYDQIIFNHRELIEDEYIQTIAVQFNNILNILYIFGSMIVIFVIIILLFIVSTYNNFIIGYKQACERNNIKNAKDIKRNIEKNE